MGRINQLKEQANHAFSMIKTGSSKHRKYRKYAVYRFIDSLYASGSVPANWYKLTRDNITSVINHWRKSNISDESIRRYLSELRYFLQAINHNINDVDNRSLGLHRSKEQIKKPFNDDCLQKISDQIVLTILKLQTEFGLTLSESFRFTPDLHIREDHILLSRDITHNSTDRVIMFYSDSQLETVKLSQRLIACNSNPIKQFGYSGVRERYSSEIRKAGLTPTVNYRHVFAINRLHNLLFSYSRSEAIKIVLMEMSISQRALRRYISE